MQRISGWNPLVSIIFSSANRDKAIIKILRDSDHKFIKLITIIQNLFIPKFVEDFIYKLIEKFETKYHGYFIKINVN